MPVYAHLALRLARRKGGSRYRIIHAEPETGGAIVQSMTAPGRRHWLVSIVAVDPKPAWRRPQADVAPNPSGRGAKPKSMPTFSNSTPLPF
jgi:hypothetical protein